MCATTYPMPLLVPEQSSVDLIQEKKCVRPHIAGWSNCEPSFLTFVLGQQSLIPHLRLLLHALFLSPGTHFLAMASKKRVHERAPVSPPPSLNSSVRCPRFAPSLSSVGTQLWLHRRSALHAATPGPMR